MRYQLAEKIDAIDFFSQLIAHIPLFSI